MGVLGGHYLGIIPDYRERFQWRLVPFILVWALFVIILVAYVVITFFIPSPRPPKRSEKQFKTIDKSGNLTEPETLPCWFDDLAKRYAKAIEENKEFKFEEEIESPELFMTLVIPAFNEEKRLTGMLEEAVSFLETKYGTSSQTSTPSDRQTVFTTPPDTTTRKRKTKTQPNGTPSSTTFQSNPQGWEILLVDDGSTDDTLSIAQTFSRAHITSETPRRYTGPWTQHSDKSGVTIPPGSIRMVHLEQNRGKGGAVTHGMRHARGAYVVFADADGASKFDDLAKLVTACQEIEDSTGRGVAVGSRAHLVGSDAVVKRSKLRNFLMHSFHLFLKFMTPPATAKIKDTQCGFKLFSRPSLPYIIPHMHTEGWIFDVEMLMLAEFAKIPVAEVAIGWKEVRGSKLNVVWDSLGMAWGLAVLRVCWGLGIYRPSI